MRLDADLFPIHADFSSYYIFDSQTLSVFAASTMPKITALFLTLLLYSALTMKPLKSQEPIPDSGKQLAATTILQEAESLTRKLAKESQASPLAKIASEYERQGITAEAERLWSELNERLKQSDSNLRQELLVVFATERGRAGNFEKANTTVAQIENATAKQKAIQTIALVLAEQSRFKDAVVYAESLPRYSGTLFGIMEKIGLAAAKEGDTKSAFRASRGMNPGPGGSMARKLRAICRMCNSFWKTGNENDAISFAKQGKKFSDIMKLDLETTMVVETTLASLQSEDLESDLMQLAVRVSASEERVNKDIVRLAMAKVLLDFDRDDLVRHLASVDENYQTALEVLTCHHIVESGNAAELKQLETHHNPSVLLMGLIRMANTQIEKKQTAEAESYLDQASQIVQSYLDKDSVPDYFYRVFSEFVATEASVGQQVEALSMIRRYPDPAMVPELMVRVVTSMK